MLFLYCHKCRDFTLLRDLNGLDEISFEYLLLPGKKELELRDVHSEFITAIKFDIAGRYFLSTGDKLVFYVVQNLTFEIRKKAMSDLFELKITVKLRENKTLMNSDIY